jgi:hypothetical protein
MVWSVIYSAVQIAAMTTNEAHNELRLRVEEQERTAAKGEAMGSSIKTLQDQVGGWAVSESWYSSDISCFTDRNRPSNAAQ